MRLIYSILLMFMLVMLAGCAYKRATYATVGGLAGGGVGYAINKDPKDAVIGGLVGGGTGYALGNVQEKTENKK